MYQIEKYKIQNILMKINCKIYNEEFKSLNP